MTKLRKKCPVCKQPIKLKNIEKHIKKAHPTERVEIEYTEEEEKALKDYGPKQKEFTKPMGLWKLGAVIAVIVAGVAGLIMLNPPEESAPLAIGTLAPNFELEDVDDNTFSIEGLRGEVIYLDFMDTDCGYCQRSTINTFGPIYQDYKDNIKMISVDVNFIGAQDTEQDILQFKSDYGAEWTYALDTVNAAGLYKVTITPTGFIIDRDGIIQYTHKGEESYVELSAQLDNIIQAG